jgi:hypothetical protein
MFCGPLTCINTHYSGKGNYAADRAAAEAVLQIYPETVFAARGNRAFLGRAIHYLAADARIRQFLDIGTGIPTAGNTHEVGQVIAPESRVVYADYDCCKSGCAHAQARHCSPPATSATSDPVGNSSTDLSPCPWLLRERETVTIGKDDCSRR